jgi:hypothetical protein
MEYVPVRGVVVTLVAAEPTAVKPEGGVPAVSILGLVTKFIAGGALLSKVIKSSAVLVVAKVLLIGANFTGVATDSRTVRSSCSEKRYSNPVSNGILTQPPLKNSTF